MKDFYKKYGLALIDILKGFKRNDLIIAELGVWKSHNLKRVLRQCNDIIDQYWAIDFWQYSDHWNYRRVKEEVWQSMYAYSCKLMQWFPQLCVVRMTTTEASKLFPEEYFDLVFIDADHRYESVKEDIENWTPLVKKGGLLTGHDYGGNKKEVKIAVDECFDSIDLIPSIGIWIKKI